MTEWKIFTEKFRRGGGFSSLPSVPKSFRLDEKIGARRAAPGEPRGGRAGTGFRCDGSNIGIANDNRAGSIVRFLASSSLSEIMVLTLPGYFSLVQASDYGTDCLRADLLSANAGKYLAYPPGAYPCQKHLPHHLVHTPLATLIPG